MSSWMHRATLVAVLVTGFISADTRTYALTINTNYAAPGQSIPSIGIATGPPTSAVGAGNLPDIVRAAADAWEALIPDRHTLTLTFGWYPTSPLSNSAYHVPSAWTGLPAREFTGSLAFNSGNPFYEMYLDPTPTMSEEFSFDRRTFEDFGAGPLETARHFRATTAEANRRNDVYTAALHEIGHALGLTKTLIQETPYELETIDHDIDLTFSPFAGSAIPTSSHLHSSTHLEVDGALLSSTARNVGQRRGITQVDLLAVCQVSGFEGCAVELAPAEFAGDLNGDGITNAADYTILRDLRDATLFGRDALATDPAYKVWAESYGKTFARQTTFEGDYNADGIVNAADYAVWRDAVESHDLRADADADGQLTEADRAVWASRYGATSSANISSTNTVPEPSTLLLGMMGAILVAGIKRS